MSIYLTLTDANSNVYNFPEDFWISNDSWDTNKNMVNRFYAAGGRNIADGFLTPRVITITGQIRADSRAAYETKYRAFIQAVLKGGTLTISNDTVSRYISVNYPGANNGQEEGQQYKEISIDFIAEDTFWYDSTETVSTNILAGDDSFSVDTTGTDFIINPTIVIDADQSADVPSAKITNVSDGGAVFTYNDTAFIQGDIVTVNSETGQVDRNGGLTPDKFSGVYIRLQPGSNTINYEGAACTVLVKYRKVYL